MQNVKLSAVYLIFCFLLLSAVKCKKYEVPMPKPPVQEQLPEITQEGKNTCGFLVNGKIWLPKGRVGNGEPNLKWWYDPAYNNGTFNINGFRYDDKEGDKFTSFVIAFDNFSSVGIYKLNTSGRVSSYSDYNKLCLYYREDTLSVNDNYVHVTKLDKLNHIIAGTFEFTLAKQGCDTVRITNGRFDVKL